MIDPARFAREQGRADGAHHPKQLPRLAEIAIDDRGRIAYRLRGYLNEKDEPALHLHLSVDVAVPCQRCLEPLELRFEVERELVFVAYVEEFDALEDEDDATDAMPLTKSLDLRDLIDQEAVLSLPMAACHPQGECNAGSDAQTDEAKVSPFSVLSKLKKQ